MHLMNTLLSHFLRRVGHLEALGNHDGRCVVLRVPDIEEVEALGRDLGFNFTREEASVLQPKFVNALRRLQRLSDMRIGEQQLPTDGDSSRRSWRLTAEQDPLNV